MQDLAPGEQEEVGAYPAVLFPVANRMFFLGGAGYGGDNPSQLWVSDGTAAGTRRLPDLCLDSCGPGPGGSGPVFVAAAGRIAYFTESTSDRLDELWRSDGTPSGTYRLIEGLRLDQDPRAFAVWNGAVFFIAYAPVAGDGELSEQLWRSDGTASGTALVADLGVRAFSFGGDALTAAGGKLFLLAPTLAPAPSGGHLTLWVSDGTAQGTRPARAPAPLDPLLLTAAGERVFFFAGTGAGSGRVSKLWVSDGSAAGTLPLTNAPSDLFGSWLKPLRGRVYFDADDGVHGDQLWVSDGTRAGTRRLTAFPPFSSFGYSAIEEVGGRLVFIASRGFAPQALWAVSPDDPSSVAPLCPQGCGPLDESSLVKVGERVLFTPGADWGGFALWSTDGSAGGTGRVKQMCPVWVGPHPDGHGPCEGTNALEIAGGAAFFELLGKDGGELWRTDGTRAGTTRFTERTIDFLRVATLSGTTFFTALDDTVWKVPQLWAGDGTAAGTRQLTGAGLPRSSSPYNFVRQGDHVVFQAYADGGSLWRSDGTAAGTLPLTDIIVSTPPLVAAALVFFISTQDGLSQLWVTDGTPGGTRQLTHAADFDESIASQLFAAPGGILFAVLGDSPAMWRSDGTQQGTVKAFDLPVPLIAGQLGYLAVLGSGIYFANDLGSGVREIWKSDGTTAGTVKLTNLSCLGPPFLATLCGDPTFSQVGGTIYFVANEPGGAYLSQTDGTPAGTVRVKAGGYPILDPTDLLATGGSLYFFAAAANGNRELWRTDGTPAGVVLLGTFRGGSDDAAPHGLTVFGAGVAFAADDGQHGLEPWISDGTPGGTRLLADVLPGGEGSHPDGLVAAAGRLFFAANDGAHGVELWVSDGTAAGTHMIDDVAPGPASSNPAGMIPVGDKLYFAADDGLTGYELWALPLGGETGCQPSGTALCLGGGRFRVEASWRDAALDAGAGQAVSLSPSSGSFWFFSPDDVELVVKILDGRPIDGHFWVFYGALSSLGYSLTVTDTQTGLARRYDNPPGELASAGDVGAFDAQGVPGSARRAPAARPPPPRPRPWIALPSPAAAAPAGRGGGGPCQPGPTLLCLAAGRFAVAVVWADSSGGTGAGRALSPATGSAGYFWFFSPDDVELAVKIVDGRAVNGRFWLFYGGLTDMRLTLSVTDTTTGAVKTYTNPAGTLASVADTAAF